jgi:hypothetical protein
MKQPPPPQPPPPPAKPSRRSRQAAPQAQTPQAQTPPLRQPEKEAPPRPRRPPPAPPGRPVLAPGETPCRRCGAGNDGSRRFCRRCGAPLTSRSASRAGWWRRFVAWLRGDNLPAGYRKRRRRRSRALLPVLGLVLALALAVTVVPALRTPAMGLVTMVKDRMAHRGRIVPVAARTSSPDPDHPPERLYDRATNRYWAPKHPPPATGEWAELDLPHPAHLLNVIISIGPSADEIEYLTQARPEHLTVSLIAPDGHATTQEVKLEDRPGPQTVRTEVDNVAKVRLTIRSVYGAKPDRRVAVGEVEIFARG